MATTAPEDGQRGLIAALSDARAYPHPADDFAVVETHISWILLAGEYAYKMKKALDLGFLDFSTLDKRRLACQEEVRLNRRTAPEIYLDVVAITGSPQTPRVAGAGPVLEYAVRMRRFDRACELDTLLDRGAFGEGDARELGAMIAGFHAVALPDTSGAFGDPAAVLAQALENFDRMPREHLEPGEAQALDSLRAWTMAEHARVAPLMHSRWRGGGIRECHGDLHLANMVRHDGRIVAFDCIEFSPALRWIDVAADLAFTLMDLRHRGRDDLARIALDAWLAQGGDYGAVPLLAFYLVYRAMVRVKVCAIRAGQAGAPAAERAQARRDRAAHVRLAQALTRRDCALLVITHGFSGAGKSAASAALIAARDWIRLRTDVERKRLAGIDSAAASGASLRQGPYTQDMTARVYGHLADIAAGLLGAGWGVIVDATFLTRVQRHRFRRLASELQVPFVILALEARRAVLEERIAARAARGGDASEATVEVLAWQIAAAEALAGDEREVAVEVDATALPDARELASALERRARREPGAA